MSNLTEANLAQRSLNNAVGHVGTQELSIELNIQRSIPVLKALFRSCCDDLEAAITQLNDTNTATTILVKNKEANARAYIQITGNQVSEMVQTISRISDILKPEIVSYSLAMSSGISKLVEHLKKSHPSCWIQVDKRVNEIHIHGKSKATQQVKKEAENFLANHQESAFTSIPLKGENMPIGLMKHVIVKYGVELEGLKDACGSQTLTLDLKNHQLMMNEGPDVVQKLRKEVDGCLNELDPGTGHYHGTEGSVESPPDCPICLCPVDETRYILQCCGHQICPECIDSQVKTAIKDRNFPIVCEKENCGEKLFFRDLHEILKPPQYKELVDNAKNHFISTCDGKYAFCPTPNCPSIYRVVKRQEGEGKLFCCPECFKSICTRCKVDMHDGVSCAFNELNQDDQLKKWLRSTNKNVKICPKCSGILEKIDGCNHVTCKCGAHICWMCSEYFKTAGECYGHMNSRFHF